MKKTWKHSWAAAIFGATAFVTTSTSQANVIVYWEEVTNGSQTDVVATWTGSLDPGSSVSTNMSMSAAAFYVDNNRLLATKPGSGHIWAGGAGADSGLTPLTINHTPTDFDLLVSPSLTFGLFEDKFYYDSGSVVGNPASTTINFDSTLHSMTFRNTDLSSMGAAGFSNTLAWTSSSGDTISYTTGSPSTVSAIPEPSSGLVLGFLLLSGLIHRRRK